MYNSRRGKNKDKNIVNTSTKSAPRFVVFLILSFFAVSVFSQVAPYITDITAADNQNQSSSDPSVSAPRLLCTFKLFNPDTLPFYIWVSFANRGRLKHVRYGDEFHELRLVDLELHYKNDLGQPMVKKFPEYEPQVKKRFGGAWLGSGRSRKSRAREKPTAEEEMYDAPERAGRRSRAVEIAFWKEDAQGYYEMELWGALYAQDLEEGVAAGGYRDVVNFDIEAMK